MQNPAFRPGFRFSKFDALLLGAGAFGSLLMWPKAWWIGFVIAFVVGHFFLFCNVFRIARALELAWAIIFIVLTGLTIVSGDPGWTTTIAISLAMTVVVVITELRKPSYHGIAWNRINPNLRQWWKASIGR